MDLTERIDALAAAISDLAGAHREAANEQARALKRRTLLEVIVFVALIATATGTFLVYDSSQTNHQVLTTVKSCTDPSGECAKRGQAQTAAVVAELNRQGVIAAFCASHSPSLAATQACVLAHQ